MSNHILGTPWIPLGSMGTLAVCPLSIREPPERLVPQHSNREKKTRCDPGADGGAGFRIGAEAGTDPWGPLHASESEPPNILPSALRLSLFAVPVAAGACGRAAPGAASAIATISAPACLKPAAWYWSMPPAPMMPTLIAIKTCGGAWDYFLAFCLALSKAAAAARNGKLGGRPRTSKNTEQKGKVTT